MFQLPYFGYYCGEFSFANKIGVMMIHLGCIFTQDGNEVIIPKLFPFLDISSKGNLCENKGIVTNIKDTSSNVFLLPSQTEVLRSTRISQT